MHGYDNGNNPCNAVEIHNQITCHTATIVIVSVKTASKSFSYEVWFNHTAGYASAGSTSRQGRSLMHKHSTTVKL